MEAAPKPDGEPEVTSAKSETSELPMVESPPLSPAGETVAQAVAEPSVAEAPAPEPVAAAPAIEATVPPVATLKADELPPRIWPRFTIRPRHRRYGVLAASVTFAAALGAVIGALASSGSAPPPAKPDVAAIEQSKAMQQSIAKLNKEIAALKTEPRSGEQDGAHADRQDFREARAAGRRNHRLDCGAADDPRGTAAAAGAAPGAALCGDGAAAAGAHPGGDRLDHPRFP